MAVMGLWVVDLHVHFYNGFDLDRAVRSAWKNAQALGGARPGGLCWCLASPPGIDSLDLLKAVAQKQSSSTKIAETTDRQGCAVARLESSDGLIVVVPGTQAISAEGLEVLSLGAQLPDHKPEPLELLVDSVKKAGGLPVVPWGVGKWLGGRGKLVAKLVQNSRTLDSPLFADNANRPWWWPYPRLLKTAVANGHFVVTGSDPLPIKGDEIRIASAGLSCSVSSVDTAWQEIRQSLLSARGTGTNVHGKPMSNWRFWRNQISLRLRTQNS
jgi:hypothetical protein